MGTTRSLVCTYVKPVVEGEVVDVECRVSFFLAFFSFLFVLFCFFFSLFLPAFFLPFFWQYLLVWQIGGTLC